MRKIYSVLPLLCFLLLFSCSNKITMEEAEKIAIEKAESDGYESPALWEEFNTETKLKYQYSKKQNKDIKAWKVHIDTANNPDIKNTPALIYFISEDNGEIIDVISGIE